jgi:hypothetical protein
VEGIAVIARDRKGKAHRGGAEALRKARAYCGFTPITADKKDLSNRSEAFAPEGERIDQGFFEPGTEAVFSGLERLSVID